MGTESKDISMQMEVKTGRKRKRTGSGAKGKAKRRKSKHKKGVQTQKLVNEHVRAHIPRDLTDLTLTGLRDFYWDAFLKKFNSLNQEEADWFNFPTNPHKNTLKLMLQDVIAQSKGQPPISRMTATATNDADEINLEIDNGDEISLDFMDEEVESCKSVSNRIETGPVDLQQSLLTAKPPLESPDMKDIFAHFANTEKKQKIKPKLIWGPMCYEWLLPHPHRHIYVPYRWTVPPKNYFSNSFKRALTLFQNSCNATRELARLNVVKQKCGVYMAEHTSKELDDLQIGCPPDVPIKFWAQRYRLWQKFDEGVKMVSTESWYSVTPQWIAEHIALRCAGADTVVDAFCGAGGNSICFANVVNQVLAVDINPKAAAVCEHNAKVYNVHEKMKFQVGNFFDILPTLNNIDVVFLGPPWGGDSYRVGTYDVQKMGSGINLFELVQKVHDQLPEASIAICLPKNCDYVQLTRLREFYPGRFEIEQHLIYGKCKMWTVYLGPHFSNEFCPKLGRELFLQFQRKTSASE